MPLITDKLNEVEKILTECKEQTLKIIADSKQENPAVNPLLDNPRIFTLSSKDLSNQSWSPRYYDYGWQFDNLISVLKNKSLDTFLKTIQALVDTGKLNGEKYHPDVIRELRALI